MYKNLNSNRSFGLIFFILFIILYKLNFNTFLNWLFLTLSILFLILTIFNSKILSPIKKFWIQIGITLGKYTSPIILAIIFIFIVIPTGILKNVFAKENSFKNFNKKKTYWINRNNDTINMDNQF